MSIETAKAKLEKEAAKCGGLEKAIAAHLAEIMDDELAALVDRPDYTVKEMGGFVLSKARKELNGHSGGLADEVVYGFATDYYHATRDEIKKNGAVSASVKIPDNVSAGKKKTEKAEAKAPKPPKSVKAQEKAEKAAAKHAAPEGQLSLFDMLGGLADA